MPSPVRQISSDHELQAIAAILTALEPLEGEAIQRVLDFVFSRLSISTTRPSAALTQSASHASVGSGNVDTRQPSIRDLKEDKKPESSNQMAAIVAYYLSEILPPDERKETLSTADLEKYFKQAGFKLPKIPSQTLPNAAAAGYFDPIGGGQYKLNPVGYNLVVHGLPRPHVAPAARKAKTSKKR